MHDTAPRLLVVAHGTASTTGSATTARLVRAIATARPAIRVDLAFLDVVDPRLTAALDEQPTIVVPLLLSTGYHVQSDIPAALEPYPHVRAARHLGPHPLLVDALLDRLPDGDGQPVLVGAGSSRAEARAELDETARLLGERLGGTVPAFTMADALEAAFAERAPVRVATYLLAEGQFVDTLRAAVDGRGAVAAPIGVHPALVELVWHRYDEAAG